MIERRDFLRIAGLTAVWPCAGAWAQPPGVIVNDLHSQLNRTRVNRVVEPETLAAARGAIAAAKRERRAVRRLRFSSDPASGSALSPRARLCGPATSRPRTASASPSRKARWS